MHIHNHPRLSAVVPALCVFVGGAIGTALRTALSLLQPTNFAWPWVTFIVNSLGALLLGFLLEYLSRTGKDEGCRKLFRLFAGTGVMGGFTTYGTFILEVDSRVIGTHVALGIGYAVVSILLGVILAGAGIVLADAVTARKIATNARTAAQDEEEK
jgi:protein CrcB